MALTKPVKLQVAGFKTKILKVSHTSLAPAKNKYRKRPDKVANKSISYHAKSPTQNVMTNGMNMFHDSVLENEGCKILWVFPIQTDNVIEHRRPNIVCINKIAKSCLINDIAIPGDQNTEKINKKKYTSTKICEQNWGNYGN